MRLSMTDLVRSLPASPRAFAELAEAGPLWFDEAIRLMLAERSALDWVCPLGRAAAVGACTLVLSRVTIVRSALASRLTRAAVTSRLSRSVGPCRLISTRRAVPTELV
jgi:hypothetical protein